MGAILVKLYSIEILWYVLSLGFFISGIILLIFGKEHYAKEKISLKNALKNTYKKGIEGIKFTLSHKIVFLIILGTLFIHLMIAGDNGVQPFLIDLGMKEHQLGYVYSLMAVAMMIFPFTSRYLTKYKPKNIISIIILIKIILFMSLLFIYPPLFYVASIILIFNRGIFSLGNPIVQTYFHKFIPKKIRATVVSSKSMIFELTIALTSIIAGLFLDLFGPQKVLAFGSLIGIIAIIIFQKIKD
jgi:predicted MFS family arabinose efflux permease